MKLVFVLGLILFLLNSMDCRRFIFNLTENSMILPVTINVYKILDIPRETQSSKIIKEMELIRLDNRVGTMLNFLDIESNTGNIILKSAVDREEVCQTQLNSLGKNLPCLIGYVLSWQLKMNEFYLQIIDENDNSPKFKETAVELKIFENSKDSFDKMDKFIELPIATDLDSSENGIEKYSLRFGGEDGVSENVFNKYFRLVNRNSQKNKYQILPVLEIFAHLDREEVSQFTFTLMVWDKASKSGECRVTIKVVDINDHAPVWTTSVSSLDIRECTSERELLRLEATDYDDPTTINGQISYHIDDSMTLGRSPSSSLLSRSGATVHTNLFYISGSTLYIDIIRLRQIYSNYNFPLVLIAKDGAGLSTKKTVNINIIDCNDHKPIIEIKHRNPQIMENYDKELKLTTVVVKDSDRDSNADFSCKVQDNSNQFELKLRLEKPLYDSVKLIPDSVSSYTRNGKLAIYDLSSKPGVKFDREVSNSLSVVIFCEDKGVPVLTNTQTVTLHIGDVNDNKPNFEREFFTFAVRENIRIGSIIGQVRARDLDIGENGRISYSLVGQDEQNNEGSRSNTFVINNQGEIQSSMELDREKVSNYQLVVEAKDHGVPRLSSTCTVSIILEDVNDCAPVMDKQYYFQIEESFGYKTIHKVLGKIQAKDDDEGVNAQIRYRVVPNRFKSQGKARRNLIQVSTDGQISIYGNVDREVANTIQTQVVAYDGGNPSLSIETTIVINVLDVNDNKPKFEFPQLKSNKNHVNISINESVGVTIAQIKASDPDDGRNGSVTYQLLGETVKELFQLHQGGQLILMKSLKSGEMRSVDPSSTGTEGTGLRRLPDRLLIQASDGGEPPCTEIATLYLRYVTSNPKLSGDSSSKHSNNPYDDLSQVNNGNPYNKGDSSSSYNNRHNNNNINNPYITNDNTNNHYNNKKYIKDAKNITLLYSLAGVLFVVFAAVLILLIFIFIRSKRHNESLNDATDIKTTNRLRNKMYQSKQQPLNSTIKKSSEDLLSPNFYEITAFNPNSALSTSKTDYNRLVLMKDTSPHYNLLYPTTRTSSPPLIQQDCHNLCPTSTTNPHMLINNLQINPPNNFSDGPNSTTLPISNDMHHSTLHLNQSNPCLILDYPRKSSPLISTSSIAISNPNQSAATSSYVTSTFV